MGPMGLFRRGGLPPDVYTALEPLVGGKPNVLAWADTGIGYAVALADRLVWSVAGGWGQVAWQDIEHGGWNGEDNELHWTTTDGENRTLRLTDPGALPGIFRERVEATILFRRTFVPDGTPRQVTITARRGLGPNATITWGWSAAQEETLSPTALHQVEREVTRLSTEYDV